MERDIEKLLDYLASRQKKVATQKVLNLLKKVSQSQYSDHLEVDLFELEALVNSKKFDFPEPDLGLISVSNEG